MIIRRIRAILYSNILFNINPRDSHSFLLFTVITLDLIWFQMNNANHGVEEKKPPIQSAELAKRLHKKTSQALELSPKHEVKVKRMVAFP